ncbi:hypothetical protein [Glaciibacter superstes]|uniref:hypothetical protein n=1 Tax=Glaciibacter superstes TaxID=501023 RepID=UPI0003B68472|nr:hypothetical protein [Glaciibacter superstes]
MKQSVLLSIRPRFVESILNGSKTYELRRRFPNIQPGTTVYLYASSPTKAIVGSFVSADVLYASVIELWLNLRPQLGIEANEYTTYFQGITHGVAIQATNVTRYSKSVSLDVMRREMQVEPAQSFRYLQKHAEVCLLDLLADAPGDVTDNDCSDTQVCSQPLKTPLADQLSR